MVLWFQSLIGILVDLELNVVPRVVPECTPVSIPDRDFS